MTTEGARKHPGKYPAELRNEILDLLRSGKMTRIEAAEKFGVHENTISGWTTAEREAAERDTPAGMRRTILELEVKNKALREQVERLKKLLAEEHQRVNRILTEVE